MSEDATENPPLLPTPQPQRIRAGVTLLPPLSRRGYGPGLIALTQEAEDPVKIVKGVPSILVKWAEEGYTVLLITAGALESGYTLGDGVAALNLCDKCVPPSKIALVGSAPKALIPSFHNY